MPIAANTPDGLYCPGTAIDGHRWSIKLKILWYCPLMHDFTVSASVSISDLDNVSNFIGTVNVKSRLRCPLLLERKRYPYIILSRVLVSVAVGCVNKTVINNLIKWRNDCLPVGTLHGKYLHKWQNGYWGFSFRMEKSTFTLIKIYSLSSCLNCQNTLKQESKFTGT